jgi:hypothetical protein
LVISELSKKILPESGVISPVIIEKQVVLPAPFGPSNPTTSPEFIFISIFFTTSRF